MSDIKRLRISKACDVCRRKKVKCDAIHPRCTNCLTFQYECTYNDPAKKRGPPKGYIEVLEARLHRMEGFLGGLSRDKDPLADIIRAEFNTISREARDTGLTPHRSNLQERSNHTTNTGPASSSAASSSAASSSASSSPSLSINPNVYHSTHQQHALSRQHHQQERPQYHGQYLQPGHPSQVQSNDVEALPPPRASVPLFKRPQAFSQSVSNRSAPRLNDCDIPRHEQGSSSRRNDMAAIHQTTRTGGHQQELVRSDIDVPPSNGTQPVRRSLVAPVYEYLPLPQTRITLEPGVILPSMDATIHLMDIYFRSVHPTLPMLHQTAIYEQLQRQEPSPSHLLFAILGLASRFSDDPVFHTPQLGASQPPIDMFFDQARSLIKEVYDYSQMETVQALLLLSIQQMGVCENHRAWLYVGMAIRMALDLGLNRELPEQDRSRDRGRAELRRRTWWSCYVVERLVCAGLGRPLTITLQECQTAFPRDDYSLGELTETTISNRQPTLISDFVHLIALLRIQGDILEFINARSTLCDTSNNGFNSDHPQRVDTSQAAFSRLDQSLFDWRHGLPSTLQTPTSQSPQFGLFLHMTYNTLIILLHRPEMTHSADSASVCIQAAATITDITKLLVEAKALTSMFVSCLQAIFSAGVIHFLNIPSADSPSDLSNPSPDGPSALDESTNPLLSAKTGLKQCTDALKILSTHWVCAAQRAKVLEDLVDQRQIALKDVETLSKTTPMMSPWVLDRIEHTKVVDISSESQDRLHHQQRRSKVMTIQSLLATEDEHHSTYHHQTRCLSMEYSTLNPNVFDVNGQDKVMFNASSEGTDMNDDAMDTWNETLDLPVDQPPSNTASEVDNVFSTNSLQCHQPQQGQLVKDPKLDSIATFGLEGGAESAATKVPFMLTESSMTNGSKTFSMPSLMTPSGSGAAVSTEPQPTQQGVMLDPFSIPSSITFPSQMQRALARAEPLFSTTCLEDPAKQMQDGPSQNIALLQPEMSSSVPRQVGYHTMAWNDMPPTLGLDEWTAYIGVLRARRQANDEPSSRSDMTP